MRRNLVTIIIIIATLVLAGIAVYTAIRLYQLRQESVAPTAPTSAPEAAGGVPTEACTLTFEISAVGSPSPSPSVSPSPSPSASPEVSPSPAPECNDICTTDTDCPASMDCTGGFCRNPSCSTETDCTCPAGAAASPTPAPELPVAGVSIPTILGATAGILLLVGAFLLAL